MGMQKVVFPAHTPATQVAGMVSYQQSCADMLVLAAGPLKKQRLCAVVLEDGTTNKVQDTFMEEIPAPPNFEEPSHAGVCHAGMNWHQQLAAHLHGSTIAVGSMGWHSAVCCACRLDQPILNQDST
jgi:hypothetical protein